MDELENTPAFEEPAEDEFALLAEDGDGGDDGGGDDDDDSDDEGDEGEEDEGDTPNSIMSDVETETIGARVNDEAVAEANTNYGINAVNEEYTGLEAPADPGPSGVSLGEPAPAPVVEQPSAPQAPEAAAVILSSILTAPPAPEMPMPENSSARLARRRSVREQSRRRGRSSTILSNMDPLGG